ncbi:MAG: hypothetical protein ACQ9IQ_12985 [Nitrospirales bacterium]
MPRFIDASLLSVQADLCNACANDPLMKLPTAKNLTDRHKNALAPDSPQQK